LENAKKNLVFHFGVGLHASFPQNPIVNAYFYLFCSTATQLYTRRLGKGSARQFKSCANGRPMPTSKTEVDLPHFTYAVKTATMKLAGFSSWQDASQTSKTMYVIIKLDK
jgi:hypothetical protein